MGAQWSYSGFTSRSASRSGIDPSSMNLSSPLLDTSRSEGEILKSFSYKELRASTGNFRPNCLLRDGRFGPVYKGWIDEHSLVAMKPGKGIAVAVMKLLLVQGEFQGEREWLAKINNLGRLQHPNLVKLIGYCFEDVHRLLVYEFMPKGSLEDHLFKRGSYLQPLSWSLRLKISLGAAKGLAFFHSTEPKVIYSNFNTSNILLDSNYNAKLSDFWLAHKSLVLELSDIVHSAPEYPTTGHLTLMCDVYSFGIVLLEMISGRRVFDKNLPSGEQYLVEWVKPYLSNKRRFFRVIDTHLEGRCSLSRLYATAFLAMQCLQEDPMRRPTMDEVVKALEKLQEP